MLSIVFILWAAIYSLPPRPPFSLSPDCMQSILLPHTTYVNFHQKVLKYGYTTSILMNFSPKNALKTDEPPDAPQIENTPESHSKRPLS